MLLFNLVLIFILMGLMYLFYKGYMISKKELIGLSEDRQEIERIKNIEMNTIVNNVINKAKLSIPIGKKNNNIIYKFIEMEDKSKYEFKDFVPDKVSLINEDSIIYNGVYYVKVNS